MKRILPLLCLLALLSGCGACKHETIHPATCTEGSRCAECGEILSAPVGHSATEATCSEDSVCSACGEVLAPATGHAAGPAATCTEDQLCLTCGALLADRLGHTASGEASCAEDVICTVCGEVLIPAAHEPDDGPTCIDEQRCLRCGTALLPPTGHTPNAENGFTCADCGVTLALDSNAPEGSYIHETAAGVHYHNTVDAYYSGAVLICGDYALEYFKMGSNGCAPWASAINSFANRFPQLNVSAMIVPKSCAYNAPAGLENRADDQRAFISATYDLLEDSIVAVDAMEVMDRHSGEYLFYRTDHHWTSLGAYYASYAYCRANGLVPRQLGSYETVVRTGCVGSLYSFCASPQNILKTNPDYTVYHLPEADCTMTIGGYEYPLMNTDTKYYSSGFIYGDNPLSVITTDNAFGRNLIIFKESYGNCFVPYMVDYYDTVIVCDIRSFKGSLSSLIAEYGITDALIINNVQAVTSLTGAVSSTLAR